MGFVMGFPPGFLLGFAIGNALGTGLDESVSGLVSGLVFGVLFGVFVVLVSGLEGEPVPVKPSVTIRHSLGFTFGRVLVFGLFGLIFGLCFGLALGPWLEPPLEPVLGLGVGAVVGVGLGLLFGLMSGEGGVWVRYAAGVRVAARRGRCPWRLAKFYDWCLERGLMRQTGLLVEFRHRELLDWYARPRPLTPAPRALPPPRRPATAQAGWPPERKAVRASPDPPEEDY
jgi:hypothetical protein